MVNLGKAMLVGAAVKSTLALLLIGSCFLGENPKRRQKRNIAITGDTDGRSEEIFQAVIQFVAKRDKNISIEDLRGFDNPVEEFFSRARKANFPAHFFLSKEASLPDVKSLSRAAALTPHAVVYFGPPDENCGHHLVSLNGEINVWSLR